MYGKNRYGLERYAQKSSTEEIDESYFVDLTKYVPLFIAEIRELNKLYWIEGKELGLLRYHLDDLLEQFFIATATWGLVYWEREYEVETNLSQSYEQRREILLAKKRGRGTTTKQMIKSVAEAFSGGEVEVIEQSEQYTFIVRFIGIKGIPRNMQSFMDALEEIKPAHLGCQFEYTYSTWDNLKENIWNAIHDKTWDEIKTI